ncbi:single-stranded DNA-binding protein [Dactylosporangium sp. NPDC048998]|uniref:single-stranded DNA-binding protein n=1 Tax=Dactylosporangium sp. NPDC048998 TaxID=3363976 RepID=UPI003724AF0F
MQFSLTVEGRLTTSAMTNTTQSGREFVTFTIVHQDQYRDHTGKWVDAKPMFFDIVCWGKLAGHVRNLTRGTVVVIEGGRLLGYINDNELAGLKVEARNVSLSMRFGEAHPGPAKRTRRADLVTTADGEQITADAYPDVVTDRELVHR